MEKVNEGLQAPEVEMIEKQAATLCRMRGLPIKQVFDSEGNRVNCYPVFILDEVFSLLDTRH